MFASMLHSLDKAQQRPNAMSTNSDSPKPVSIGRQRRRVRCLN